jgi:hypothetical protein
MDWDLFCSGYEPKAGCREHGSGPAGSIKVGDFSASWASAKDCAQIVLSTGN